MSGSFRGYASWLKLFMDNFPFETSGKLATLWFDEIVIQVPQKDMLETTIDHALECSSSTRKELKKTWIPVTRCLPYYRFLSQPFESRKAGLVEAACRITDEETKKEWSQQSKTKFSRNDPWFLHETAWASAGLIDSINVWIRLNEKNPCTYLPTLREQRVLQKTFSEAVEKKPNELFSELMTRKIPDLAKYSWDNIVEMRHHEFFCRFREKMVELSNRLNSAPKAQSISRFVDEISRVDMEQMLKLFKPSPKLSTFEAIASNVPLPIPINPLGVILSALDMKKQMMASKKYGWLYFLIDLPKKPEK